MVRNIENPRTFNIPHFILVPHYMITSQNESWTPAVARDPQTVGYLRLRRAEITYFHEVSALRLCTRKRRSRSAWNH